MLHNSQAVAFCGEHGAFAELALFKAFGEKTATLPVATFAAVFEAADGPAVYGVVPIENSLAGSVHENYDNFLRYPDVSIVGEIKLRIVHCLIVHPDAGWDTIKIVRSHPQGLAQCKVFLDERPGWKLEAWNNTAAAVVSIAKEENPLSVAAIASDTAARLNGLKILKSGIETNPANYTRFVIIAGKAASQGAPEKAGAEPGGASLVSCLGGEPCSKASVVFSIKDEPGSLYSCLKILKDRNVNLSKIESRPIHGQPWHYMFYLDLGIPPDQGLFSSVIEELKTKTEDFHFLGSYKAAE